MTAADWRRIEAEADRFNIECQAVARKREKENKARKAAGKRAHRSVPHGT